VRVSLEEYAAHWIAAGRGPEYAVQTYALPLAPSDLRALKDPVYHEILRERVVLMDGVIPALTRLQVRFPLALATNSNRQDTGFVIARFGLGRFFAAVVTRDDYARAKPEPDAFLTAAARLRAEPAVCLVVEDAHKGVMAAHRAGAAVAAVPNRFTRDNDFSLATAVLDGLHQLTAALVDELLARHAQQRTAPAGGALRR